MLQYLLLGLSLLATFAAGAALGYVMNLPTLYDVEDERDVLLEHSPQSHSVDWSENDADDENDIILLPQEPEPIPVAPVAPMAVAPVAEPIPVAPVAPMAPMAVAPMAPMAVAPVAEPIPVARMAFQGIPAEEDASVRPAL